MENTRQQYTIARAQASGAWQHLSVRDVSRLGFLAWLCRQGTFDDDMTPTATTLTSIGLVESRKWGEVKRAIRSAVA